MPFYNLTNPEPEQAAPEVVAVAPEQAPPMPAADFPVATAPVADPFAGHVYVDPPADIFPGAQWPGRDDYHAWNIASGMSPEESVVALLGAGLLRLDDGGSAPLDTVSTVPFEDTGMASPVPHDAMPTAPVSKPSSNFPPFQSGLGNPPPYGGSDWLGIFRDDGGADAMSWANTPVAGGRGDFRDYANNLFGLGGRAPAGPGPDVRPPPSGPLAGLGQAIGRTPLGGLYGGLDSLADGLLGGLNNLPPAIGGLFPTDGPRGPQPGGPTSVGEGPGAARPEDFATPMPIRNPLPGVGSTLAGAGAVATGLPVLNTLAQHGSDVLGAAAHVATGGPLRDAVAEVLGGGMPPINASGGTDAGGSYGPQLPNAAPTPAAPPPQAPRTPATPPANTPPAQAAPPAQTPPAQTPPAQTPPTQTTPAAKPPADLPNPPTDLAGLRAAAVAGARAGGGAVNFTPSQGGFVRLTPADFGELLSTPVPGGTVADATIPNAARAQLGRGGAGMTGYPRTMQPEDYERLRPRLTDPDAALAPMPGTQAAQPALVTAPTGDAATDQKNAVALADAWKAEFYENATPEQRAAFDQAYPRILSGDQAAIESAFKHLKPSGAVPPQNAPGAAAPTPPPGFPPINTSGGTDAGGPYGPQRPADGSAAPPPASASNPGWRPDPTALAQGWDFYDINGRPVQPQFNDKGDVVGAEGGFGPIYDAAGQLRVRTSPPAPAAPPAKAGGVPAPPASTSRPAPPGYVAPPPSARGYAWPVPSLPVGTYSSEPGDDMRPYNSVDSHAGVDIPGAEGDPISAVAAGTVISTDRDPRYGVRVIVRGDDGNTYLYAHLQSHSVQPGMRVGDSADPIGRVGSTGHVTGPHLHLEVHDAEGRLVDPRPLFVPPPSPATPFSPPEPAAPAAPPAADQAPAAPPAPPAAAPAAPPAPPPSASGLIGAGSPTGRAGSANFLDNLPPELRAAVVLGVGGALSPGIPAVIGAGRTIDNRLRR